MNREELKNVLPYGEPMLLLDEAIQDNNTSYGIYLVKGDAFFMQGHFTKEPVVPGVILCEILAQSAYILFIDEMPEGKRALFTGISKARSRLPVHSGQTIRTECRIVRSKGSFYFVRGLVKVEGKMCASAELSFALV